MSRHIEVQIVLCIIIIIIIITLRAKLSGVVYCNRSCLFVCVCVFVGLLPR